ncbi:MAG: hypothetical protein U0T74_14370 [Chitinophagales bacterium]
MFDTSRYFPAVCTFTLLLNSCKNSPDCHAYTGTYNDRGKELTIEQRDKEYVLLEETSELPCRCNSKGQLEIQGANGPVVILLSESAGKKRFCFTEDSLHEDCIYQK